MSDVFKKHGKRITKEDAKIPQPILDVLYSTPSPSKPDFVMTVRVPLGEEEDKRDTFTNGINLGLCAGGTRITPGLYQVTIRKLRLTKTEHRYLKEIQVDGAPKGWGRAAPEDGRKGVDVSILARLQTLGLIKEVGMEFRLTFDGILLAGDRS